MCGIVGFAGGEPINEERLLLMRDTMTHRGPDDQGCWFAPEGDVGFGHRRLSIIDLSPGGHQPMADRSGRLHICFNGEIYNFPSLREELEQRGHAFCSKSDTEVIIEAFREWGEDFLVHLNGMFAMALYDEERRELFLARDRAGEKPLFYWRTPTRVVFASELKALFAFPDFPRVLDLEALEAYLAYGYVPGEMCMLEGVRKLRPGHIARFRVDSGEWTDRAYWTIPRYEPALGDRSIDSFASRLEALLQDAVRQQLMADVPVAILLSGGLDSSLVTAMAVRASSSVKTFTVAFPGHGVFNEAEQARLVARHFGTEHVELNAQDADATLLPRLARQFDEPMADSSMIPTFLVSSLIREHATVALGGDGGDELFGGYPHYMWLPRLELMRKLLPSPVARVIGRTAGRLRVGMRGRSYLTALGRSEMRDSLSAINVYFDRGLRGELLKRRAPSSNRTPEEYRIAAGSDGESLLQAAQRMDFRTFMVDDILVKVDRASMLASLETRAPFLDHRIVEFAFGSLPDAFKANLRQRKILLRHLASRLLPRQLVLNRKQGFSIPLHTWFAGAWGKPMREILDDADPDLFHQDAIDRLVDGQQRGYSNSHRLFTLVIFELWRRAYDVRLPN
jgi:asparagine synthase (glutamine-hydrolysing)